MYVYYQFKYLARAYELETKWVEDGYAPTMEEYFANRIATSMGTLLLASFVGMGEIAKVDAFDWLHANPRIAVASAMVGRLFNDLASSEVSYKLILFECNVYETCTYDSFKFLDSFKPFYTCRESEKGNILLVHLNAI